MIAPAGARVRDQTKSSATRVSWTDGVLMVTPLEVLDTSWLSRLDELIRVSCQGPLIIDLTECIILDPRVLGQLDPSRWDRPWSLTCVVSSAEGERLFRDRPGKRVARFCHAADALRALVLARSGYGDGWGCELISEADVS